MAKESRASARGGSGPGLAMLLLLDEEDEDAYEEEDCPFELLPEE